MPRGGPASLMSGLCESCAGLLTRLLPAALAARWNYMSHCLRILDAPRTLAGHHNLAAVLRRPAALAHDLREILVEMK